MENTEENFSDEDLRKYWDRFVESIRETEPRIYTSLRKQELSLKNDHILELKFRNNTLIEDFKLKTKPALLASLRRNLRNSSIEIEEILQEEDDAPQTRFYTDKDKLNYLAEKNPLIKKLFKDFNLDFE